MQLQSSLSNDYYCFDCKVYLLADTSNPIYYFTIQYQEKLYEFIYQPALPIFFIANPRQGIVYTSDQIPKITPSNAREKLQTILTFL